MNVLDALKNSLVVSCQALEEEPLHSSYIMSRMAVAAKEGGARGIRANTVEDIKAIKESVNLPVIGIIKQEYPDSEVYITPTKKELDDLLSSNVEIIALDGTNRVRPRGESLKGLIEYIRSRSQSQIIMADISTVEEAIQAEKLGVDCISTTLVGYTDYTKNHSIFENGFSLFKQIQNAISIPLIAEGNIDTPEKAAELIRIGAHFVVVGGAITRPQLITKKFSEKLLSNL